MASIKKYKTTKGYAWRVQYRSPDGRSRTKQPFRTKNEAEVWAATNTVALTEGTWVAAEKKATKISELYEVWLESKHLAPSSLKAIRTSWTHQVADTWGKTRVGSIQTKDVQAWVNALSRDYSPATVHKAFGVLQGILGDALTGGLIHRNPCEGVRLPAKKAKKQRGLTRDQLELLADCTKRHKSLILFLGYTGARWGEAVALTVGDVDLKTQRAFIGKSASTVGGVVAVGDTKTGRSRTIAIPGPVIPELRKAMRDKLPGALIWTNRSGGYVTTPSRRSWWHSAVDKAAAESVKRGLPVFPKVTPHDLRHAAASILISSGASVMVVQRQLGHASAKMTLDRYAHLFDDDLDKIAQVF